MIQLRRPCSSARGNRALQQFIPTTAMIQVTRGWSHPVPPSLSPVPRFLPFPTPRNHAATALLDPNPSLSRSQTGRRLARSAPPRQSAPIRRFLLRCVWFVLCIGGWSRDDNAGVSGETELLVPPRRPVARRSRHPPRLRRCLHRRAPPRRRGLPPEVSSRGIPFLVAFHHGEAPSVS